MDDPIRIAVVDDDDSVRESLEMLLRSLNFAANGFASAEAYLKSDYLFQTRVLILDVRMPGTSGIEFQRRLKEDGFDVPIIFITAHGDKTARHQAMKNGAVAFLQKPFSDDALVGAINSALRFQYKRIVV